MSCCDPKAYAHLPWEKVATDDLGGTTELLFPAIAIAVLLFHPANWPTMHKRAAEEWKDGKRHWHHPMTCDEAVRAQAIVDMLEEEEGWVNLLVMLLVGKDKTDVSRTGSMDPSYLKLLNTSKEQFFHRVAKILLAIHPIYTPFENLTPAENTAAHVLMYAKSLSLVLLCLEVCAEKGIRCQHKYVSHTSMPYPMTSNGATC